jgi:putative phosphoesterase
MYPSMRIAVFSDTHDRYPSLLPGRLKEADEIWHLGDVCDPAVLGEFERLGPPLVVVRGNCDEHAGWPHELRLERAGIKFYLTHIPPSRVPPGTQVVLHGHIHRPRDEWVDGVRWLCPGSAAQPRGGPPSYAWLDAMEGNPLRWSVVHL